MSGRRQTPSGWEAKLERWYYRYAGLRVVSEIELPEWAAFATPHVDDPEIVFRMHPLTEQEHEGVDHTPVLHFDSCSFFVPDAALYHVRNGSEILVRPAPGAGMGEVRLFLLGSAWGMLCYQRGIFPLHAGVVRVGTGAVAFCGPSGAGKSTAAAWLYRHGASLVSDDLSVCEFPEDGPPYVWPGARRFKLWSEAIDWMGWSMTGSERDHFRTDKFHLPQDGLTDRRPVPLRGLYVLEWGEPRLHQLNGFQALQRVLAAATYRGDVLAPMGLLEAHWHQCMDLVRRVPVWEFRRPRAWDQLDGAMQMLWKHWQTVGAERDG